MSSIQARVCSSCSGASWMKPSRRTLMEEFLAEQVEVVGEPGREVPRLVRPAAADGGALRLLVGSWFG